MPKGKQTLMDVDIKQEKLVCQDYNPYSFIELNNISLNYGINYT